MAERRKCICGHHNIRRIPTGQKGISYDPRAGEESYYGSGVPTPTIEMRPAKDGLCERCKVHGVPRPSIDELARISLSQNRARGTYAAGKAALNKINFNFR